MGQVFCGACRHYDDRDLRDSTDDERCWAPDNTWPNHAGKTKFSKSPASNNINGHCEWYSKGRNHSRMGTLLGGIAIVLLCGFLCGMCALSTVIT